MNRNQISAFERVQAQMQSLYAEVGALSKKKPDDAINRFKLGLVNEVLRESAKLLGKVNLPISSFEVFADDALPTNSDVLMALSLYLNALEKLRSDNIKDVFGTWYWIVDGKQSGIQTGPPHKLKY